MIEKSNSREISMKLWNIYFFLYLVVILSTGVYATSYAHDNNLVAGRTPLTNWVDHPIADSENSTETDFISQTEKERRDVIVHFEEDTNPNNEIKGYLVFLEEGSELFRVTIIGDSRSRQEIKEHLQITFERFSDSLLSPELRAEQLSFDTANRACSTYSLFFLFGMENSEITGNIVFEDIQTIIDFFFKKEYLTIEINSGYHQQIYGIEDNRDTALYLDEAESVILDYIQPGYILRMYRVTLDISGQETRRTHVHTIAVSGQYNETGDLLTVNSEAGEMVYRAPITQATLQRADVVTIYTPKTEIIFHYTE